MGGATVSLLEWAELGVWVSEVEGGTGASLEHLREHDAVVGAALRTATPLPVRYGARFHDEGTLREAFQQRADVLTAGLAMVRDRLELGVRVGWDGTAERAAAEREAGSEAPAVQAMGPGRAYLEGRRAELRIEDALRRRAGEALDRVAAEFTGLEAPTVRTVLPDPETAGTLAHLVHRNSLSSYRQLALRVREVVHKLDVSFSGPWAPYSFAYRGAIPPQSEAETWRSPPGI